MRKMNSPPRAQWQIMMLWWLAPSEAISRAGHASLLAYLGHPMLEVPPLVLAARSAMAWAESTWPVVLPTLVFVALVLTAIAALTVLLPALMSCRWREVWRALMACR